MSPRACPNPHCRQPHRGRHRRLKTPHQPGRRVAPAVLKPLITLIQIALALASLWRD
ncbi:hypothetical protein FHS29_005095 [Saccharothrix tamanrassetensis]|uniref:Uncharacterized protein n=1 Tax=Saccharothrix tamanrassetensis TaxID=1051531 RepID=A0A841CR24_9PSEU|nr:hypothetical protein [Saccharothrix tamanrassetensis]